MKDEIERRVVAAATRLLAAQPDLFQFTDATKQTEWNITHHLATELHREFPDHQYDIDPKKPGFGGRRPDIIIHQRRTHARNLLVVEVKRDKAHVAGEIEKIENNWFQPPLQYRFGAVVVINEREPPHVTVLENGNPPAP